MISKEKTVGHPGLWSEATELVTALPARPGLVASPSEPHAGPEERPKDTALRFPQSTTQPGGPHHEAQLTRPQAPYTHSC